MKKIGIAVIGFGWMGQAHSRSYARIPSLFGDRPADPELVICCDNVEERGAEAVRSFGFGESTTDPAVAIAHPDVDVVVVAAPNMLHEELCLAAAAAGKHIFCEKPVGGTPEQTARVEKAAREAGVITGVGYNYRWAPLVMYAKQLIADGVLGEVSNYRGRFFSMYGSDPLGLLSWRFEHDGAGYEPKPGEGTHYDRGAPGDPTGPVSNEDYAGCFVRFANGSVGNFEASRSIVGPQSQMAFEVYGTKGSIMWNLETMNEMRIFLTEENGQLHDGYTTVYAGDRYPYHGAFVPGDANAIGYEDLKVIEDLNYLEAVANNKQHQPGFSEALAYVSVQSALIRSWESGKWEEVQSVRLD